MDVNVELAEWSNLMIYSAMAVYTIALIFSTIDLFGRGERAPVQTALGAASRPAGAKGAVRTSRQRALVTAGGPDDAAEDADGGGAPGEDSGDGADEPRRTAGGKAVSPRRMARIGTALIAIAVVLHVAAVVLRTASVQRVPWGNMMEYALTATALIGVAYLVSLFFRDLRFMGTFVSGALLIALGLCITVLYTPAAQLIPALDTYWILIHVPVAIFSTVLLYLSAGLTLFQLAKQWYDGAESPRQVFRFLRRLPEADSIERLAYRVAGLGFVTWTFTLIAGAVWAEFAWGRYWGWDTKEVWTFVVWVIYAAYLHARATRGWTTTAIGVLNLMGFLSVLFNFYVVNVFFTGLHSYSGL
ncbi:c-type cytochrome biogenesis protein CcsB [Sediminivirga luteola]|uniref:c-type cytochrome biogenesis protein CcsB n=1 Tax=Sediminivirga luteola TaxID=1774748 RepID=UPI001F5A7B88|nr:c-type cytochrome biogenesis protein CcsB [Sediminivirga luteola]